MVGVVFLIVVPTANFEYELLSMDNSGELGAVAAAATAHSTPTSFAPNVHVNNNASNANGNNLNINLPDNNAVLRLEVELRDKNVRRRPNQQHQHRAKGYLTDRNRPAATAAARKPAPLSHHSVANTDNYFVPMEKVLEELLLKLEIEHVTWSGDKKGYYHTIIFPLDGGDPCETTLHCLTKLGIGVKPGSSVSVIPCSVSYNAIKENTADEEISDCEEASKWNNFVDSIRSKLTVKQVVDGVRSGGSLSFDYVLLIITADALAALGLIENNSANITAAMLVSPLMGPVMAVTFGTMISDRQLIKSGFLAFFVGMLISVVFGFIFGLIVGTTQMPWGLGDWPTEEMRGRGNARSLWMGIAWALTSGTGVALALLLGATGPMIGVAISASLLPPVVNCGIYWALACIWLIYDDIKMPHLKGEPYTGNSSYVPFYTEYVPTEFFISGIVSASLTIINVICIFITAMIVLKIKEVAAPYTSSPDLRRFWETDIRNVRRSNRSTIRRKGLNDKNAYENLIKDEARNKHLESALQQALKEATDDQTFRKVKRLSYSANDTGELIQRLGKSMAANSGAPAVGLNASIRRKSNAATDLMALDKLVSSLLERQQPPSNQQVAHVPATKLGRLKSLSLRDRRTSAKTLTTTDTYGESEMRNDSSNTRISNIPSMPTILESSHHKRASLSDPPASNVSSGIRHVINTIKNAPHRFSHGEPASDNIQLVNENANLKQNILD